MINISSYQANADSSVTRYQLTPAKGAEKGVRQGAGRRKVGLDDCMLYACVEISQWTH
jgi:hypothetical protein